jgi:hypothetical protein
MSQFRTYHPKVRRLKVSKHVDVVDISIDALAESVLSIVTDDQADEIKKSAAMTKTLEQFHDYLKLNHIDIVDVDPRSEALPAPLKDFTTAMMVAEPGLTQQQAMHQLLHTAHGRKLAEHLGAIITKGDTKPQFSKNNPWQYY